MTPTDAQIISRRIRAIREAADWPCGAAPCPTCGTTGDCRLPPPGPERDGYLRGRREALADAHSR